MEWLTLWLKKIILLVLLAAFLDLILPNTNLQKYVKMVMGLIILLTILTPLFSLFSISTDELALKINRFQESQMNTTTKKHEWVPLANKLLGQQDQQMAAYVIANLEKHIQTKLQEDFKIVGATVQVTLTDKASEQQKIKDVFIRYGEKTNEYTSASKKEIEPVVIEIDTNKVDDLKDQPAIAKPPDKEIHKEIATTFARELAITTDRIHITDESENMDNVTSQRR